MNGWGIIALLILSSSLPALVVYFWFRVTRYPISLTNFLMILLTGAAAVFPALLFQNFFPRDFNIAGRVGLLAQIFLPIAFTEELSRLVVLFVYFAIARKISFNPPSKDDIHSGSAGETVLPAVPARAEIHTGYGTVVYGSAVGLIAGFGFAILEGALSGAVHSDVIFLRLFTAAPIHGACGARIGSGAILFRAHPGQGLLRFFTAVVIHGIYNSMIIIPGFASIAALLIAVFSLASAIFSIHGGMKPKASNPTAS
jgi:RsiW-degrading membrane proteinase PrsW (M82 family)